MMMTYSELSELNQKLPELKIPELSCALRRVIASHLEALAILDGHDHTEKSIYQDYQAMKELTETLQRENDRLNALLKKNAEQLQMRNSDLFGRGTEQMSELSQEAETAEDPLSEEESSNSSGIISRSAFSEHKGHGKRKKGQRDNDLSGLPVRNIYQINPDQLNEEYGTDWYIYSWKKYRTVECVPSRHYVQCVYVPVISHGKCFREIEYTPMKESLFRAPLFHPLCLLLLF